MHTIRYISNEAIDKAKWDACIERSTNGLIYAYSWYLGHMSKHWDALVLNDYEAVMPLTWNKKMGIRYLYQPHFCASLGIFSTIALNGSVVEEFLDGIPDRFRFIEIHLNHNNFYQVPGFPFSTKMNYTLDLSKTYASIYESYRTNLKRNIKKALDYKLICSTNVTIDEIIELASPTLMRNSNLQMTDWHNFKEVLETAAKKGILELLAVRSTRNELLASAVFLFSHQRWYYILVGNHPNGKTLGASHYLIDQFIQQHAGEDCLLDFEGSDVRNLAFFYSSYGAKEETYPALRINRLPLFLKWLKK
jgi:hypothetical protein